MPTGNRAGTGGVAAAGGQSLGQIGSFSSGQMGSCSGRGSGQIGSFGWAGLEADGQLRMGGAQGRWAAAGRWGSRQMGSCGHCPQELSPGVGICNGQCILKVLSDSQELSAPNAIATLFPGDCHLSVLIVTGTT